MCGICGIVAADGLSDPETTRLRVAGMLGLLFHRGPDASRQYSSRTAEFGATRLMIRGLEESSQPMVDGETGVVAVCNGEIDNHRELRRWLESRGREVHYRTDVAVIPGLYLEQGEDFVRQLSGAFAIGVWDPRNGQLLLARDRAGERPLFYTEIRGEYVFATELAAVARGVTWPLRLDESALCHYLQFGSFPAPESPFAEVRKVSPGECLRLGGPSPRHNRYWRWRNAETPKQAPSLEACDDVFRAAVRRQGDADVEFGIFLSGGLDSSLVAAVARDLHPKRPLKSYTLSFDEETFDESAFAETVAGRLNLVPVTVLVKPEDICRELPLLVRRVGEPLADPAWVPMAMLAGRAAQDVRFALVGEGADELFGGYPTYLGLGLAERLARLPSMARWSIRRAVRALPESDKKMTISFLLKRFIEGSYLEGMARHCHWVSNITPTLLQRLGLRPAEPGHGLETEGELLDRVQRWDLETSLAEGLLTKADRASMNSALELRAPFLDKDVMEFAETLPLKERVSGFTTKVFLKRYALRYLPREIVHRRKRGLSVPLSRWLRGPLREWAGATLSSGRLELAGVKMQAVRELFGEHCERKADHARAVWTLLVLSQWLDWVAEETEAASGRVSARVKGSIAASVGAGAVSQSK